MGSVTARPFAAHLWWTSIAGMPVGKGNVAPWLQGSTHGWPCEDTAPGRCPYAFGHAEQIKPRGADEVRRGVGLS